MVDRALPCVETGSVTTMNALNQAVLADQLADLKAQTMGNHFWANLINLAGLCSKWLDDVLTLTASGEAVRVQLTSALWTEVKGDVVTWLEDRAIDRTHNYDASRPPSSSNALVPVVVHLASHLKHMTGAPGAGAPGAADIRTAAFQVAEIGATCLCGPRAPRLLVDRLIAAVHNAGLPARLLEADTRPWRLRDRLPHDRDVLAFEAALLAGQRAFAYDILTYSSRPPLISRSGVTSHRHY